MRFLRRSEKRCLLQNIPARMIQEIATLEQESGIGLGGLRSPVAPEAEKLIVRSLDQILTGGKHHGLLG